MTISNDKEQSRISGNSPQAIPLLLAVASAVAATIGSFCGGAEGAEPVQRRDPPPAQAYKMRLLVYGYWANQCGSLDGPAGQAESTDQLLGHDVDEAGNVYWPECNEPIIRCYRPATDRVVTLAGSIRGLNDGPLNRARFGGWSYNSTSLLSVSADGKHLFVLDRHGKGLWRHVDLEAGTVSTLGPVHRRDKGQFVIAKDTCGAIFAFCTNGDDPPECKGYQKLKVTASQEMTGQWLPFDRFALDAEKMRFYWHCRGPVYACDLKTGQVSLLTAKGRNERPINTSGPLETTTFLCPTGMAISPAGRYLYVGQGDGSSCFRLDLEKKASLVFGAMDDGGFGWRETGKDWQGPNGSCAMTGSTGWPAATVFLPDGRGYWNTCWGIYGLTPMKGGK
jgi:hypothetical protein